MDNTTYVGLARLWGQSEHMNSSEPEASFRISVMQGYDDMDLARLLDEWAHEFLFLQDTYDDLNAFFEAKVKALCDDLAMRTRLDGEWEKERDQHDPGAYPKAILVERDYKGEYERFALTPEEFQKEFPETYRKFGPITKADSDTLRPLVHIWFQPCTVNDHNWEKFFTDMQDGLYESDIDQGVRAYIRWDLFGELRLYISPYTYVKANEHTGASEETLLKEWADAMTMD